MSNMNDIAANEEPLAGMLPKTLSQFSNAELRVFVDDIRNLRSTSQTLRARMAIQKSIKADAKEAKQIESEFGEF
jgi:hypothetical protein